MITHGKGGWDWNTIYHLPVFLRTFYAQELMKVLQAEEDAVEETRQRGTSSKTVGPPQVR